MSAGVGFVVVSTTAGLTPGLYGPVIQTYAAELVGESIGVPDEIDVLALDERMDRLAA